MVHFSGNQLPSLSLLLSQSLSFLPVYEWFYHLMSNVTSVSLPPFFEFFVTFLMLLTLTCNVCYTQYLHNLHCVHSSRMFISFSYPDFYFSTSPHHHIPSQTSFSWFVVQKILRPSMCIKSGKLHSLTPRTNNSVVPSRTLVCLPCGKLIRILGGQNQKPKKQS